MAHLTEFIKKQIERAYLNGEGTKPEIAKRFDVSLSTVERVTRGKGAIREAADQVKGTAIADHVRQTINISGAAIDQNELLITAINDLSASVASTEAKSKEGAAAAMVKLLDAWRDRNPETMQDIIARCLELGYKSDDFFKELDKAWEGQQKA